MKKQKIKQQNGFVISDAMLAILMLVMFVGIITSLIYNIVLTSKKIKINSQEISYVTDVLNYAQRISYQDVSTEKLVEYVNRKEDNTDRITASDTKSGLKTPYKMSISVENYNQTPGNTEKEDIMKIITVNVECKLSGKIYSTEMKSLRKIKNAEM